MERRQDGREQHGDAVKIRRKITASTSDNWKLTAVGAMALPMAGCRF